MLDALHLTITLRFFEQSIRQPVFGFRIKAAAAPLRVVRASVLSITP
jgi:hypothetical protein